MSGYTAAVGLALAAVSATVGVAGAAQQTQVANSQAKYQAGIARNNMILANRAADRARAQGEADAQDKALQTRQLIARQGAVLAGNGVDVGSGSALDIFGDTAAIGSTDKQRILNNAAEQADNFAIQGANFNSQANLYNSSISSNALGIGGAALSGIGSVADKWYKLDNSGFFDSSTPNYSGIGKGTNYSRFGGTF